MKREKKRKVSKWYKWFRENGWWFIILVNVLFLSLLILMGTISAKLTHDTTEINCQDITGGSDSDFCDDATGAGLAYDLNVSGTTGSGTITDSEIFSITGNGTANVKAYVNGNGLIIEATDTTGSGGNTTEEMQDAVGSGFTGNLTYNDAGNSYDVNASNILTWLNGFYRRLVVLITGSDIALNTLNSSHIIDGTLTDNDVNKTNLTLADFTNDADFTTNVIINNGSYFNVAETDPKWSANYSTFLTHITMGDIWATLGNGTMATTSYSDTQNTSQTNTMTTQNTSQTNYINSNNVSITNSLSGKRDLSNFTFTGNVNITASNLSINSGNLICLNYGCSQWIKANATGVFIQG